MPTRKQRRRREKELRHEWEEVYVDAEGREIPPEEAEALLPADERRGDGAAATRGKRGARDQRPLRGRGGREIKPPSWKRVLKRGAIFAPFMYLFIALTSRETSVVTDAITTVWLLLIFLPFSYLMDSLTYRMVQKRQEKAKAAAGPRR